MSSTCSFISLQVLEMTHLETGAGWLRSSSLKFEAGREEVGKGGVVPDPIVHERVCTGQRLGQVAGLDGAWSDAEPDHGAGRQCRVSARSGEEWLNGQHSANGGGSSRPAICARDPSADIYRTPVRERLGSTGSQPSFMPPGWVSGHLANICTSCWAWRLRSSLRNLTENPPKRPDPLFLAARAELCMVADLLCRPCHPAGAGGDRRDGRPGALAAGQFRRIRPWPAI